MRPRTTPLRAVASAAALGLFAAGCSGGATGPRDPTPDQVRVVAAAYLRRYGAEVAVLSVTGHHVGLYVRGTAPWPLDTYVAQLPAAAETARLLLTRFPALRDADVCGDGYWLPHPAGTTFVPAAKVVVYRDRLDRLPARFAAPVDVLDAGLRARSIDFVVDARIIRESAAYRAAFRALARRYRG